MGTQEFKRKLAAVFSADVEGYSRLMSQDEEATGAAQGFRGLGGREGRLYSFQKPCDAGLSPKHMLGRVP